MWIVTLRDHTGSHPSGDLTPATSTKVDKTLYPTQEAAIAQAAKQLGIVAIYNHLAHCWWEVY
jgi:hypothetical protein